MRILITIVLAAMVLIYASGVYFLWSNANSMVILNQRHLSKNSLGSPDDYVRGGFAKMGCREEECSCAVKKVYTTTSRAQRLLVKTEGTRWNMFFWRIPAELTVINSLHFLDVTDEQIAQMRNEGKQKFAEALKACRG